MVAVEFLHQNLHRRSDLCCKVSSSTVCQTSLLWKRSPGEGVQPAPVSRSDCHSSLSGSILAGFSQNKPYLRFFYVLWFLNVAIIKEQRAWLVPKKTNLFGKTVTEALFTLSEGRTTNFNISLGDLCYRPTEYCSSYLWAFCQKTDSAHHPQWNMDFFSWSKLMMTLELTSQKKIQKNPLAFKFVLWRDEYKFKLHLALNCIPGKTSYNV